MLEGAGYEVVGEAADAATAIAAARSLRPEVMLVDVGLPDGDGFSVSETLAGDEFPPTVVLISARDRSDYGRRIRTCGARGFVSKDDLSPDSLRAVLSGERS